MSSVPAQYSEIRDRGRLNTAFGIRSKTRNFHYFLEGKDETTGVQNLKRYFDGRTEIFTNALLIGFFHNKKSSEKQNDQFNRVSDIRGYHEVIVKMIFIHLSKRPENIRKTSNDMLTEICSYADGGIEYLMDHYNENNTLKMEKILEDLKPKMKEMAEKIRSEVSSVAEEEDADST